MKTLLSRPVRLTRLQVNLIKCMVHLLCTGYLGLLFWAGINDNLGADPVEALLHGSGIMGLNILVFTITLSQLAKRIPCGDIIKLRRLSGIYAFIYALSHFFTYVAFELQFNLVLVTEEIIKRPYILVGFVALIILLLLTLTSPMNVRRWMKKRWQSLHNYVYLALILVVLHYTWSLKTAWQEPVFYWVIAGVLAALRFTPLGKR